MWSAYVGLGVLSALSCRAPRCLGTGLYLLSRIPGDILFPTRRQAIIPIIRPQDPSEQNRIMTDLALVKVIALDVRTFRPVANRTCRRIAPTNPRCEVTRSRFKRDLPERIYDPCFPNAGVGINNTLEEGTLREIFDIESRLRHLVLHSLRLSPVSPSPSNRCSDLGVESG